jgi:hypothetical protein
LHIWTGKHVSLLVVNVTWADFKPLAFILHFFNHFSIVLRLVCSFCEAMARSLSVSSPNVAAADFSDVGRSAVYSSYSNDPQTMGIIFGNRH